MPSVAHVAGLAWYLCPCPRTGVLPHAAPAEALHGEEVLTMHGAADEELDIHRARWARAQFARSPVALTYRESRVGHGITPGSLAVVSARLTTSLHGGAPASAKGVA